MRNWPGRTIFCWRKNRQKGSMAARQLREAVALLSESDREIIRRFYDLCQTAPEIAAALGLTPAAVRMRLVRSREAIRNELCRGGFAYE